MRIGSQVFLMLYHVVSQGFDERFRRAIHSVCALEVVVPGPFSQGLPYSEPISLVLETFLAWKPMIFG